MDKTFNFFKTKAKKEAEKARNASKSNSSKCSYTRSNEKGKIYAPKFTPLTKKERDIREAIQYRYQKSKIKQYRFSTNGISQIRSSGSSDSSQMQEYRHLKGQNIIDLKEYHRKLESKSSHSSHDRSKFKLRVKLKQNSSTITRTQGNEQERAVIYKRTPPAKISKQTEEWKFISIQLKEDLSKPKSRKTEVKINTHRSYNVQEKGAKVKPNGSSSTNKYFQKVPKLKELGKLNRAKF